MEQVLNALTKMYGRLQPLTGGFTNATYLLRDATPPLVAKVAALSKQDLQNESIALQFLDGKGIAPEFIETLSIDSATILITTFKYGKNGQSILDTGDIVTAGNLFHQMGVRLARDIHSISFDGHNTSFTIADPFQTPYDFVSEDLYAQCEEYFKKINMNSSTWVLTHGDYGSHNILFGDNNQFTVIDWEWSEWFHPLVDIAWSCWNTKLHYPSIADSLNQTLIKAYQSINPIHITDDELKAYVIYKIWTIFNRLQNADGTTQEKWINRLRWTLNNRII